MSQYGVLQVQSLQGLLQSLQKKILIINNDYICNIKYILLLLLLKEVDIHPISPKTPASLYQPIGRKKRTGKIVEHYSKDSAV